MKKIFLLMLVALMGCGGESKVKAGPFEVIDPVISVEPTNNPCIWWRQPNQNYNGVPKYSGSFCTYTHKHIPLAVHGNGSLFYTTTTLVYHGTNTPANGDVGADTDFLVYAHKDNENQLVHKIEHWTDPHTNAAIQLDNSGYVNVHVASRGLSFKFQSGKHLKSQAPYQLDFECLSGCNDVNFEAYPQAFDTSFGYYLGYTHYVKDPTIHPTRNIREIWYKLNGVRTRIAKGAHYQNTYYHNGWVYVAFNWLKNGSPEERYNLYVIKTSDGINWKNVNNQTVTLPLEQDDATAKVYQTEPNLVYLKDITYHIGPHVLFTESSNEDPTQGQRTLKSWWSLSETPPIKVTETNHNYSAGAYVKYDNNLWVLANPDSGVHYLGGDINLYKMYSTAFSLKDTFSGANYSYIRKVYGIDGLAVAGEGESDVYNVSQHVKIKVQQ